MRACPGGATRKQQVEEECADQPALLPMIQSVSPSSFLHFTTVSGEELDGPIFVEF